MTASCWATSLNRLTAGNTISGIIILYPVNISDPGEPCNNFTVKVTPIMTMMMMVMMILMMI